MPSRKHSAVDDMWKRGEKTHATKNQKLFHTDPEITAKQIIRSVSSVQKQALNSTVEKAALGAAQPREELQMKATGLSKNGYQPVADLNASTNQTRMAHWNADVGARLWAMKDSQKKLETGISALEQFQTKTNQKKSLPDPAQQASYDRLVEEMQAELVQYQNLTLAYNRALKSYSAKRKEESAYAKDEIGNLSRQLEGYTETQTMPAFSKRAFYEATGDGEKYDFWDQEYRKALTEEALLREKIRQDYLLATQKDASSKLQPAKSVLDELKSRLIEAGRIDVEDPLNRYRMEPYFADAVVHYRNLPNDARSALDKLPELEMQKNLNNPALPNEFLGEEVQRELYQQASDKLQNLDKRLAGAGLGEKEITRLKELRRQVYNEEETKKYLASIEDMNLSQVAFLDLVTAPLDLIKSAGYLQKLPEYAFNQLKPEEERKPTDFYDNAMFISHIDSAIQSKREEELRKNWIGANIGNPLYQIGRDFATELATELLSKVTGPAAYVSTSFGEGTDAYLDAIERGASEGTALIEGAASSLCSAFLRLVPANKYIQFQGRTLEKNALRDVWNRFGARGAVAAMRYLMGDSFDRTVAGEHSKHAKRMEEYRKNNLHPRRIWIEDIKYSLNEIFWAALGAQLSID